MRAIKLLFIFSLTLLASVKSYAAGGYLVLGGGKITSITNTSNHLQNFGIQVTGGATNLCPATEGLWITFPLAAAPDAASHQRAYATALLAFSLGKSVNVYNYADLTCVNASYIHITSN